MSTPIERKKPTRRSSLTTAEALVATSALGLAWIILSDESGKLGHGREFIGVLAAGVFLAVIAISIRRSIADREPFPPAGRQLEVQGDILRQVNDGQICSEIDLCRDYEYQLVDRYEIERSLFRLYQNDTRLSFYVSDPGGIFVVRELLRIEWPPRDRHVGRSYPPTAA